MDTPKFNNKQNELITTTDGRKLYHSRSVAVTCVLVCMTPDGTYHIAIEKRGNAPGLDKQGLWCLPCGYLDWDESAPDAVRREVWEEIGLDLRKYENRIIAGVELSNPWAVKTEPDENRQNVTLRYGMTFLCSEPPKLIPNNDCEPNEVSDAVWAKYSDILLDKYEFAFNHKKVIQEFWNRFIKKEAV